MKKIKMKKIKKKKKGKKDSFLTAGSLANNCRSMNLSFQKCSTQPNLSLLQSSTKTDSNWLRYSVAKKAQARQKKEKNPFFDCRWLDQLLPVDNSIYFRNVVPKLISPVCNPQPKQTKIG
jgi:hypothetical protein